MALRLEAGYTPDGWLGPLCLNNIYYDFTTPQTFDEEWTKLRAELSRVIAGNTDSSGAGLPGVFFTSKTTGLGLDVLVSIPVTHL